MDSKEYILHHIKHYEKDIHDSYMLYRMMENGVIKGNGEDAQLIIEETKEHIKYVCFFMCCFLDLASSLKGLLNSETRWERKFYLKSGFVVVYESINTFSQHQKEIRDLIKNDFQELETNYKILTQQLRKFKKENKYDTAMSNFRNKAGAHYDKDFINYFEHLNSIDGPESDKTLFDFSNFLMRLIEFWCEILDEFQSRIEK